LTQSCVFRFKGDIASSGFQHAFSITTWLRIIPSSGKLLTYLIFELQEPQLMNFDPPVQSTMMRLYLNQDRLELVDFAWKTTDLSCRHDAFRITQSNFEVTVTDGLWHHVAVSVSTDLQKVPRSRDDPDLLYLFGFE
jgi:hypothetical protein